MGSIVVFLRVVHFLGLGLALGASTAKLVLLLRARKDPAFAPTYRAVAGTITRLIMIGMALLVLSGISWLLVGYPLGSRLIVKLVLVVLVFLVGISMDKFIEPAFFKLAPKPNAPATPEFARMQQRYLLAESVATGLFYVIVIMWVLR